MSDPYNILAIDPGTDASAWVEMDQAGRVIRHAEYANAALLDFIRLNREQWHRVAVEEIECMGLAVGRETFQTVRLCGRIHEIVGDGAIHWVTRRRVKMLLCGSMQAKDPNIRRVLLDRYGGDAAGKKGGALNGIATHRWSALAVAVVALHELNPVEIRRIG